MGDFNIRLGRKQDQEFLRGVRGGEKKAGGSKADNLIREIEEAEMLVVHGRACKCDFAFYPIRK